jgi:hypothetical protein
VTSPAGDVAALEAQVDALKRRLAAEERRVRLLDTQLQHLDRERQKLASMVHHADAGFVAFDVAGRVAWTNAHFVRGFGHDHHPASFLRASCHQSLCDRAEPCDGCPVARCLASRAVEHHEVELTFDGSVRTVYLTALPIRTMTGEMAEVMVMVQDLSRLRTLKRAESSEDAPAR